MAKWIGCAPAAVDEMSLGEYTEVLALIREEAEDFKKARESGEHEE